MIPDSLSAYIDRHRTPEPNWSAQIVNSTETEPIHRLAENLYGGLNIETSEVELDGIEDDLFLVLHDGKVVASSPMKALKDTLLMVNADLYRTGTKSVAEIEVPDVVLELSETVFTLQGFPESNTEKLVLTLISRYIEQQALTAQTGTLRTSFQRLSRLDDERGTYEVYKRLGQHDELETHVYGLPDWGPSSELDVTSHGIRNDEIQKNWFVVYRSDTTQDVAMVANEIESNTWQGYWTFDTGEIREVSRYIRQTF